MLTAAVFACGFGGAAFACNGQPGATVFEDNFADDTGGWELSDGFSAIKPPQMVFTLGTKYTTLAAQNLTFNATDGDYCLDFTFPPTVTAANPAGVGIQFWATDYNNTMVAYVGSTGQVTLFKRVAQAWTSIWSIANSTAVKPGANEIRVIVKAGKIDVSVNGTEIKAVRAQEPQGTTKFGIYAELDAQKPEPVDITMQGFKITAGQ